ncbi:MAG: hypothetical protein AB7O24_02985 [Kofleriaceae bacterium]
MNVDEAERLYAALRAPVAPRTESWGQLFLQYSRDARRGPAEAQVRALRELYASPELDASRRSMVERLEQALFPVLAQVLQSSPASIKAAVHRDMSAFADEFANVAPVRSATELSLRPLVSHPQGWSPDGGFRVFGGALVLGETPDADENTVEPGGVYCLVRPAHNGSWYVLRRPRNGQRKDLVVAHESAVVDLDAVLARIESVGETMVHGGASAVTDAEVRRDRDFLSRFEYGEETERHYRIGLGGDGVCTWNGTFKDSKLVLVHTPDED